MGLVDPLWPLPAPSPRALSLKSTAVILWLFSCPRIRMISVLKASRIETSARKLSQFPVQTLSALRAEARVSTSAACWLTRNSKLVPQAYNACNCVRTSPTSPASSPPSRRFSSAMTKLKLWLRNATQLPWLLVLPCSPQTHQSGILSRGCDLSAKLGCEPQQHQDDLWPAEASCKHVNAKCHQASSTLTSCTSGLKHKRCGKQILTQLIPFPSCF